MSRILISILVTVMGIVISPHISFAEEIDPLLAINEDISLADLTDAEKFERAKEGLTTALSLALDKVAQLAGDLNNREFDEGTREAELRAIFIENLAAHQAYYSEILIKAEAVENLEAAQALAQEVKTYRDATYTPDIEGIVGFISVFYAEDVLRTAKERLDKVSLDIEKLETLGLIETDTFGEQISVIGALLTEAEDLRVQAKDIILAVPEATTTDGVLLETVVLAPTTTGEVNETPTETLLPALEPRTLLQTSLGNVKASYEIFLEISNAVKEKLGLE